MALENEIARVAGKSLRDYTGIMRTGPALDESYVKVDLELSATLLDGSYWIGNMCNGRLDPPSAEWFSKEMRTSIAAGSRPKCIVDYLKDLYVADTGRDGPACAITFMLLSTSAPHQPATTTTFCASATNRRPEGGQVHAEYVTTRLVVDLATEWAGQRTIQGVKLYTLTSKVSPKRNGGGYNQESFPPCQSCENHIGDIVRYLKTKVSSVTQLGDAVVLG